MQQTTSANPLPPSLPAPVQPSVRLPHLLEIAWTYVRPLLPIVLFTVVLWLLHHEFSDYRRRLDWNRSTTLAKNASDRDDCRSLGQRHQSTNHYRRSLHRWIDSARLRLSTCC